MSHEENSDLQNEALDRVFADNGEASVHDQDPAFKAEVEALETGVSLLVLGAPSETPRPELRDELMRRISATPEKAYTKISNSKLPVREILAWAAVLLLGGFALFNWNQLTGLKQEIITLKENLLKSREIASLEIESLEATIDEYKNGVALVIWDQDAQTGILKLEKMPPLKPDQDYQLWVVDPNYKNPVDSGVISVSDSGFAKVKFKPGEDIKSPQNFAISIERKGGVPVTEGPIVLLSP